MKCALHFALESPEPITRETEFPGNSLVIDVSPRRDNAPQSYLARNPGHLFVPWRAVESGAERLTVPANIKLPAPGGTKETVANRFPAE